MSDLEGDLFVGGEKIEEPFPGLQQEDATLATFCLAKDAPRIPEEGDVVKANGQPYRVTQVEPLGHQVTVHVEPMEQDDG